MKAAVCEAFGKPLVLSEVSAPSPGGAELLIRVSACGVCHSDLHLIDGEWRQWGTRTPFIPGHEVTGIVEEAGPEAIGFAPGNRVGVPWMQFACGECATVPSPGPRCFARRSGEPGSPWTAAARSS